MKNRAAHTSPLRKRLQTSNFGRYRLPMASVTEKPQSDTASTAIGAEQLLVDKQIGRTRRALKIVDFSAGLITLAIGILAYLLTMSVLEHWVIPGGWSDAARVLLFAFLILGSAWYSWRTFWPLIRQSVNPAYAALAIEESSPSLKNSLLNLLLLRSHKREMSRQVYQAIEAQAADGLSQVRMETVVDRSAILRLGYILVALTAICVAYRVLSPKDLFTSAGRVLLPWANIVTPSRVSIAEVTPGDTKTARGEQLRVSAEVIGLEADEPVQLVYSTADKQIVRQEIPMSASESGTLFSCRVPSRIGGGDRRGVQQDFTYWIKAGDARSPRYTVTVYARPTMVVNRLRYDYPSYTGYPSRKVQHTGDIRAVEGTRVTLFAEANQPIKTAHVDFEADGRHDLLMKPTDQQATVTFPLQLREDRRTPEHRSYVLKYTTLDGNQNQLPPKYQIEVQPDYAPEIQLLLPEEAVLDVAANKEVNFEVEARDPDFALGQVMLVGQVGQQQRLQHELLNQNHTGKFVGKWRQTPEQMGLRTGDILEYWAVAADNRRPEANLAYSAHRKLRVIDPWRGNEDGEQNQDGDQQQQQGDGGDPQNGEGGQEGQAGGGETGNSDQGEGQDGAEGQAGKGQQGGQSDENNAQQQGGEAGADGQQDGQENQGNNAQGGGNSPNESGQQGDEQNVGNDPSEDPADGSGGGQGKVSPEGDDDGTAFERMAEHFNEQQGQPGDGNSQPDASAADGQPDSDQNSEGNNGAGNADQNSTEQANSEQGSEPTGNEGTEQQQSSQEGGAKGETAPGEEQPREGGNEQQQQDGEGANGEMLPEQGEAGEGDQSGQQQGAPNADETKNPQDKQGDSGDGPEEQNSEAAATGRDQSESDSKGSQGGDRSGGGKQGAGQQADESGKGAAGQNEAADEGAGQAADQGEGETGQQAGDQQQAEGKTGESSGDQSGQGSEQNQQAGDKSGGESTGEGQNGQPGEQPSDAQPGENDNQRPQDQQPPGETQASDAQGSAGQSAGTGGKSSDPPPGSETQPADDANLDYAKKQTDLILDRLEDQLKKKQVDESLLEKLGWTQEELRRFVDRWKNLKDQADSKSESQDELNEALRSLGLNRNRRTGYNSKVIKDKLRDLQDAYRGRVPLEYQEQVNRYIKGTANSQENE